MCNRVITVMEFHGLSIILTFLICSSMVIDRKWRSSGPSNCFNECIKTRCKTFFEITRKYSLRGYILGSKAPGTPGVMG